MTVIYCATNDQVLVATRMPKISCNNQNTVKLHVDFDATWNGYAKSAVFYTSKNPKPYEVIISSDGNCLVPTEVLIEEATLFIGIKGVKTSSSEIKSTAPVKYRVLAGTPATVISAPSPSVYQQLLEGHNTEKARLDNLVANSGTVEGDEVVDARVGVGDETHGTAGTAMRDQLKVFSTKFAPTLELGTLSEGIIGYSTTRARMTDKLRAYRTIVKCGNDLNYLFGYAVYDKYGNFDGVDHGWNMVNGGAITFTDCYFQMNFKRTDNAEITETDIETLQSLFTITEFTAVNDIAELKETTNDGYKIPLSFELELGSIADGQNAAFTTRARFVDKVKATPKTVATMTPNYSYLYGYAFYDENGEYDGVDHGWINPVYNPTVTFPQNGYVRFNFRRTDEAGITDGYLAEIASLFNIVDKKNISDVMDEIGKVDVRNDHQDVIASIEVEHGRTSGASYVFARIPKTTNNGKTVKPKLHLTSADGSLDGSKVSALTFARRNKTIFAMNGGLFDTGLLQPVGQTIIDGVSITNAPMTDDMGSPISANECYPLCIDANGDLSAPYARSVDTSTMIADGVVEAVTGWGKVVENFAACSDTVMNEIVHGGKYIRQVIGQFQNGDYFVCTVDMSRGTVQNEAGLTYSSLAQLLINKGVKFAYSLDGGGSAETVIGVRQLNPIYEGTAGRAVPTVITFEI